jgi:hypothetical protein
MGDEKLLYLLLGWGLGGQILLDWTREYLGSLGWSSLPESRSRPRTFPGFDEGRSDLSGPRF